MDELKDIEFSTLEALRASVEKSIATLKLQIGNVVNNEYHFIFELVEEGRKLGRLKIYYNQKNKCTSYDTIDPFSKVHLEQFATVFPKKGKTKPPIIQFCNKLHNLDFKEINNYRSESVYFFKIKEITNRENVNNREVWLMINTDHNDLKWDYLWGDLALFDYLQWEIEVNYLESV